jgi:phosphoesterase RecJ-like protein
MSNIIPIDKIENSHHILIKSDEEHFPQASVLYSFLLTKQKKVSLYMENVDGKFSFLPWYEKVRSNEVKSADLSLTATIEILDLYHFLKTNGVKINQKMATALYAGFLKRYDNFISFECNGTVFAVLSELLALGAQQKLCVTEMLQKQPLSLLRLKALVYKKLLLKENARLAEVKVCSNDFEASGSSWDDMQEIAKEILHLVHVEEVHIINVDENKKILKIIKEV